MVLDIYLCWYKFGRVLLRISKFVDIVFPVEACRSRRVFDSRKRAERVLRY